MILKDNLKLESKRYKFSNFLSVNFINTDNTEINIYTDDGYLFDDTRAYKKRFPLILKFLRTGLFFPVVILWVALIISWFFPLIFFFIQKYELLIIPICFIFSFFCVFYDNLHCTYIYMVYKYDIKLFKLESDILNETSYTFASEQSNCHLKIEAVHTFSLNDSVDDIMNALNSFGSRESYPFRLYYLEQQFTSIEEKIEKGNKFLINSNLNYILKNLNFSKIPIKNLKFKCNAELINLDAPNISITTSLFNGIGFISSIFTIVGVSAIYLIGLIHQITISTPIIDGILLATGIILLLNENMRKKSAINKLIKRILLCCEQIL